MGRQVTLALVDYAAPQPGMAVLDLATGTGEPAITLASRVGPAGHVTALDQSAELLKIAEERARERRLTNITTCQADAHKLPFPTASFDLITCRFGVMFFREQALRETLRVLKPGCRACFVVWGPFEQPYWASMIGIVHKHVGGPMPPAGQNPFEFSQPGSLSAELRRAGFDPVEEETRTVPWTWPGTPQEVWEQIREVSAPFRDMLQRVPAEKWDTINREVMTAVRRYVRDDEVQFGAVVVLASGTKPQGG
jgi:SAM-dependent methyltransferase